MVSLGKPGPQGWIFWGIWTEYIINNLFITHKGPYTEKEKASILGWATSGAILFALPQIVSKIGLGTIGWVLGFYYSGKWLSQWIDPDEGMDNFHGFISAGNWSGSNDPNYGSAQRPGSGGYFDIAGNLAILILAQSRKEPYWSERANTWVTNENEADEVLMRQLKHSASSGSFTTPEALWEYGFITDDEYLKRISARRVKTAIAKEAKRRWNKLSHAEQKNIVNTKRDLERQASMLFAQGSW
jgi:hypothetical protein